MQGLHISFMRDLKNIDFEGLYKNIILMMERQQHVDDPVIQVAFDRLKPHVPKFNDALRTRVRNEHSIENDDLTKTRTEYLISLRRRVKSYLLSHIPKDRVAAKHIYFVLKRYDKTYYVPSITTQSQLVHDLFSYMREDEKFKESFAFLKLNPLMNAIENISIEIHKNSVQCTNDNVERKNKTDGVREDAYRDMKYFVNAIHFTYESNLDDEEKIVKLDRLIWLVNDVLKQYRTPMRAQTTKNKNRKTKNEDEDELVISQQEPQGCLPSDDVKAELKAKSDKAKPQEPEDSETNDSIN